MTDERTCRCKGQFAMHKPALHADRDGSEARAQLEREHHAYLAADKDEHIEPDRLEVMLGIDPNDPLMKLAKRVVKAEAALARVEARVCEWESAPNPAPLLRGLTVVLRNDLDGPDAEAAS